MQSLGEVKRIGVECTGTYGAGLLRYLQQFDIEILEITSPDRTDRRKCGEDDTIDAENAAHAALLVYAPSHLSAGKAIGYESATQLLITIGRQPGTLKI